MRAAIYVALLAVCAVAEPGSTQAALASAASVVLETLPYLTASALLRPVLGRVGATAIAFAGCGCSSGPGARSIPAAIATAALFGPWIAALRFGAALIVALLPKGRAHAHDDAPILDDLRPLYVPAVLCGICVTLAPILDLPHRSAIVQLAIGAALGFFAAPCALGGVALAAALRVQSPLASAAVLAIAGIVDLRVWWHPHETRAARDRMSYALIGSACALVAYRHGASLVHPRLTWPLWTCAIVCAMYAFRTHSRDAIVHRTFAVALVAAVVLGCVPPPPVATAATLDDAYPGERVDFTGMYAESPAPRVVRYAITCCRADAAPVAVPLAGPIRDARGSWIRVRGVLARTASGGLALERTNAVPVAPPSDPFIYR
ncbi:MAG: hypothetical protein JOZ01_05275 [Candidatus Eremiobacteraeota bacterium]|nr:hypothetical protein [Candidatus Eremiobacteraeota bacterium]